MLYPLPLGMVRDGYLVVHERKGGESEEAESPPLKVSLFLDFRKLGPIRVDLLKDSVGVFVRVACGSEQVLERIAAGKDVLEQSLLSMKVPLQSLTLVQGAIPAAAALLQMATGEEQRVFSARV